MTAVHFGINFRKSNAAPVQIDREEAIPVRAKAASDNACEELRQTQGDGST